MCGHIIFTDDVAMWFEASIKKLRIHVDSSKKSKQRSTDMAMQKGHSAQTLLTGSPLEVSSSWEVPRIMRTGCMATLFCATRAALPQHWPPEANICRQPSGGRKRRLTRSMAEHAFLSRFQKGPCSTILAWKKKSSGLTATCAGEASPSRTKRLTRA